MNKIKILMIQETLSPYSIPVFNIISEKYDFTLMYSEKCCEGDIKFNTIYNPTYNVGIFAFYKNNILKEMRKYDLVICSPYIKYINLILSTYLYDRKNVIYYGIGVAASYKNHYDSKKYLTKLLSYYLKTIGACVFYSKYPIKIYENYGVDKNKLFVANNTTYVEELEKSCRSYNSILFVGTLYKEKGIRELLRSYKEAYLVNKNIKNLVIIGDGDEKEYINDFIDVNGLNKKIKTTGAIFDEKLISKHFSNSIACISPNQAGLSVLKSMGYGVPFITKTNAITGGEIFNIKNGKNGILYNEDEELKDIILDISNNPEKYVELGNNAKEYYKKNCTIEIMASGFIKAIEYALDKRKRKQIG